MPQEPQPTLLDGFVRLPQHTHTALAGGPRGPQSQASLRGLEPAPAPSRDLCRLGCILGPSGILHQTPEAREAQTHSSRTKPYESPDPLCDGALEQYGYVMALNYDLTGGVYQKW